MAAARRAAREDTPKAKVVIIGRPNVGKSTLFNRLVGKRLALVDDTPGVTRDRREGIGRLFDLTFTVIDTAGLEDAEVETLAGRMRAQTEAALGIADVALMVVDARAGLTPLDRHFADWIRAQKTPVILVANKTESGVAESGVYEAFELGLGDPVPIAAEHGLGMADLYDALRPHVDAADGRDAEIEPEDALAGEATSPEESPATIGEEEPQDEPLGPLKLAIVGRPNAGKSTLINTLLGEQRLVTGPEAGITRDSIAVEWQWREKPVRLIDTAGLRKRAKVVSKLERLSAADTQRAVDFAEVVVLLLDATLGLEGQDLRIADRVLQEGRALVIALNKWDALPDQQTQGAMYRGVTTALADGLSQVKDVPVLPVSGLTGRGLDKLLEACFATRDQWSRRLPTAALNRWFEATVERNPPPAPGGKRIKLRYMTQARNRPPTFAIFGTRTTLLPESYKRYLINALRADFGFEGVPLRLNFRGGDNPFNAASVSHRPPKAKR